MNTLEIAIFLSTVTNRLVEGLVRPIWDKYKLDTFWLMYVSWGVGTLLVLASGVDFCSEFIPYPVASRIVSGLIAGGGANLIHDLMPGQGEAYTTKLVKKLQAALGKEQDLPY